jgi:hypothetical protein
MNAAHKKKLAALILERLASDQRKMVWTRGELDKLDLSILGAWLDALTKNGFDFVVRHRSKQGKLQVTRKRRGLNAWSIVPGCGGPRWKYDPVPKAKGKIHLNLLSFCRSWEPNDQRCWKQVWVALDKGTAMKALVLGYFPEPVREQTA